MKKFSIYVREILEREVEVEAKSKKEAYIKVEEMYNNEEIVLDSSDYIDTIFEEV
jgi:hypothetical protein